MEIEQRQQLDHDINQLETNATLLIGSLIDAEDYDIALEYAEVALHLLKVGQLNRVTKSLSHQLEGETMIAGVRATIKFLLRRIAINALPVA
jgi:hypothetical protein